MKYKITRKKLVKLAFKAIKETPGLTDTERGHLLYGACTMPAVAAGNWVYDKDCGCLVGTLELQNRTEAGGRLLDKQDWMPEVGSALYRVGCNFDNHLQQHLVDKYGQSSDDSEYYDARVEVTD